MVKKIFVYIAFLFLTFSQIQADVIHTIQKGETIYGLSKKYGISIEAILNYNGISDGSKILVGQKIKIPDNKSIKTTQKRSQNYIVKKGDTIYSIARLFGISQKEIFALNNLNENSLIRVGQRIKVPVPPVASTSKTEKNMRVNNDKNKKQKQHNATDSLRTYTSKKANTEILWPIKSDKISYLNDKTSGVVLEGKGNDAVKAIASGKVVSTGSYRGYSNVVFVKSNNDYIYVYAGLNSVDVKLGTKVQAGTKIGSLPEKALLTSSKLYFMVYKKNSSIDPALVPRGL